MSQNLSRRQLLRASLAGSATLAAAAVHAAPAGLYKPGTYTAKAAGIAGDVRVSMTFETDRIVDVVIDASRKRLPSARPLPKSSRRPFSPLRVPKSMPFPALR